MSFINKVEAFTGDTIGISLSLDMLKKLDFMYKGKTIQGSDFFENYLDRLPVEQVEKIKKGLEKNYLDLNIFLKKNGEVSASLDL